MDGALRNILGAQRGKEARKGGWEETKTEKNRKQCVMDANTREVSCSGPHLLSNSMQSVLLYKLLERTCIYCLYFLTFHSLPNTLKPGSCFTMPQSQLSFRSSMCFLTAESSDLSLSPSQPRGPAILSPKHFSTSSSLHPHLRCHNSDLRHL